MMSRERAQRMLLILLGVALIFRLALIAVDTSFGLFPVVDIASAHARHGHWLAQAWLDGRFLTPIPIGTSHPNIPAGTMETVVAYTLAPFYLVLSPLFGDASFIGRIAIAVYSLGLGYATYVLARELRLTERLALATAAVTVFWPSVVYRSVAIQREVFIAIAVTAVVWVAARWATTTGERPHLVEVVTLAVAGITLLVFRRENLLIVFAPLVVALGVRYRHRTRTLAAVGVFVALATAIAAANFRAFIFGAGRSAAISPKLIDSFAHRRAHGDTAYLTWLHYHSWLDIVLYAPVKVVYLLGSPLPWRVHSTSTALASVSGLVLLATTVIALYAVVSAVWSAKMEGTGTLDRRVLAVLVTFLVVGIGAYAVIEMNGGAAFRRRIAFVPAITVLAVAGLASTRRFVTKIDDRPSVHGQSRRHQES